MEWHTFPVYNSFLWVKIEDISNDFTDGISCFLKNSISDSTFANSVAVFLDLDDKEYFKLKMKYNDVALRLLKIDKNNEKDIASYKKVKNYLDSSLNYDKSSVQEDRYFFDSSRNIEIYKLRI